jgi:hypothetical protein
METAAGVFRTAELGVAHCAAAGMGFTPALLPCRGATRGVQKAMLNDQIEQHQLTHIAGVEKRFNKAFCLVSCCPLPLPCLTSSDQATTSHLLPPVPQEWLDERTILFGTKCNRLIKLDILTHKHQNVPTPPEPAQRSAPDLFAADPWHAVGGGIHALETSPCGRYLATGARNPHDALVLRRHDLTPVQTCMVRQQGTLQQPCTCDRVMLAASM